MLLKNRWILALTLVLGAIILHQHKFNDTWKRPINGDAKGYYAYLPAIFIYQDLSYSFVDSMEMNYYPNDGSQAKSFRVAQDNGTVVNKCFPGTAIFYLPFFLLATLLSWILGFPMDGYSQLYQWSIAFAHLFYLFLGLHLLFSVLLKQGIQKSTAIFSIILLVFGTNIFYYLVYDFTLSHIFGFFGTCLLMYFLINYKTQKNTKHLYATLPLLALLILMRPTNAMLMLLFPLLFTWKDLQDLFKISVLVRSWKHVIFAIAILSIAPILWKLQTGHWLVYSYGNEKMDLLKPHLIDFLFSYKKGWWLWTPLMLVAFILGSIYFWRRSFQQGLVFTVGLIGVVYVFSSWWIWTFGTGFGQRPVIEFYPFLILGLAGFMNEIKWKLLPLFFLIFIPLNIIQAYQMENFILHGGTTTKQDYWSHFLQLKVDAPKVSIHKNWKEVKRVKSSKNEILDNENPYSFNLVLNDLKKGSQVVVKCKIGGLRDETHATIVLSSEDGTYYYSKYIQNDLYEKPRQLEYSIIIDKEIKSLVKCYIWNGESQNKVTLEQLEIIQYKIIE